MVVDLLNTGVNASLQDYKVSPLLPSLLQKCGSLCNTSIVYVHVQEALPKLERTLCVDRSQPVFTNSLPSHPLKPAQAAGRSC